MVESTVSGTSASQCSSKSAIYLNDGGGDMNTTPSTPKRSYETPAAMILGQMTDLTKGGGHGSSPLKEA